MIDSPGAGVVFFPADMFTLEEAKAEFEQIWEARTIEGYGARMSAPGYLDCTEWSVFDTEEEAYTYINNAYAYEDKYREEYPYGKNPNGF